MTHDSYYETASANVGELYLLTAVSVRIPVTLYATMNDAIRWHGKQEIPSSLFKYIMHYGLCAQILTLT